MKARINYKSKKTIIIIAIAVVLLIAAITGTVAFIKGNNNAAAAMENTEVTEPANSGNDSNNNGGVENPNTPNTDNPEQIPIIDDNQNPTTPAQNGDTTTNPGTTTNQGTTTGATTGNAGTTIPDTEYTQTTVVENPWKTEDITWAPISLQARTETAGLNINTPDLEVTKTAYVGNQAITAEPTNTVVQPGQEITYVIRIKNTGNLPTSTIRTIDAIPEGTELVEETISEGGELVNGKITWKNVIAAGETVELSFKVKVISEKEITLISNTAKVNGEDTPTTETPVVTTAKEAYLVVDGELAETTGAKVGDTLRYVITITNNSNVPGKTTVTDTIPDGTEIVDGTISEGGKLEGRIITWNDVNVKANGETTVSFDVIINKETAAGEVVKEVTNAAVVGEKETPQVITPVANITGKKEADKTEAKVGDTLIYTITLTNSGNAEGTVTVTDEIPAGTSLVAGSITGNGVESNGTIIWNVVVPANDKVSVSFKVTVDATTSTGEAVKEVTNAAVVGEEKTPQVITPVANITGKKEVNTPEAKVGDTLTYTITLTNSGNAAGTVTVTDEIPAGTSLVAGSITGNGVESNGTITWNVVVPANDKVSVSFKVTVNATTSTGEAVKEVTNAAVVDGKNTPQVITPVANITGKKEADKTEVKVGDKLKYTITLTNSGNAAGTVTVTDEIPEGTSLVAGSITGNGVESNGTITWNVVVPANDEVSVSFEVNVNATTSTGEAVKEITNAAVVDGENTPQVITPVANITTVKSSTPSSEPLHELDRITYTLIATNSGNAEGTVVLTDTIPEGTTLVPGSITGDGVESEGTITWNVVVPAKEGEVDGKVEVSFTVKINPFESETKTIVNDQAKQDGKPTNPTTDTAEKVYVDITVNKKWEDEGIQKQRRPSQIRFELYAGNELKDSYVMNINQNDDEYTHTFTKKPKYNSEGERITYTVQEKEINTDDLKFYQSGYLESEDSDGNKTYNFTNTFIRPGDKKTVTVTKIWEDNSDAAAKRPGSVILQLNGRNVELTPKDEKLNNGDIWSTEIEVDVYNNDGEEIEYKATEDQVPQWYEKYEQGTTVKNTFKAPTDVKYDITLTKVWEDSSDIAKKRPTSVKFDLYKIDVDGKTEVLVKSGIELKGNSNDDEWTIPENVQKYDEKANEIKYFVKEETTGSIFYIKDDKDPTDLTITNKFSVPADKAVVSVKKVWNDKGNTTKRKDVTIRVTGEDGKYEDIVLTKQDANINNGSVWEKNNVTTNLPKYDSLGDLIDYTFDEVNIPDGYIRTVKDNEITNSLPGIKVTKTVSKVQSMDAKEMNEITVKTDDVIEYEITVTNIGTIQLRNLTVTDNLNVYLNKDHPEITTTKLSENETLDIGETKRYTVYYKVTAEDAKLGSQLLTNIATANAKYEDSNGNEQNLEDQGKADVKIQDLPGIEIDKTQKVNGNDVTDKTKVQPGDVIDYIITVTNTGNTVLKNVTVTDSMSSNDKFELIEGNWYIGELGIAPNNVATIKARYEVQEADMKEEESIVKNVATVTTTSTEPKSDEVEVITEVWKSEITVEKTSELIQKADGNTIKGKAEYGDTIKYTITATNAGRKQGTIDVTDGVPTGTKLKTPDNDTNLTEAELAKLAEGERVTRTLAVPGNDGTGNNTASIFFEVIVTAKPGEKIQNIASASDGTEPEEPGYNVEKKVSVKKNTRIPKIKNSNVVIVLDVSGSMNYKPDGTKQAEKEETRLYAAQQACNNLIDSMFKDDSTGCQVSVVTFSSGEGWVYPERGYPYWGDVDNATLQGTATNSSEATTLKNKINALTANGGTRIAAGINEANTEINKLAEKNKNNQNIVIVLSDGDFKVKDNGEINKSAGETESRVKTASNNLKTSKCAPTVYAVAFASSETGLMKNTIASDADKTFMTASDYKTLLDIFTKIGSEIGGGENVEVASNGGLIELPGLDENEDITIKLNGDTTGTTGRFGDDFFKDKIIKSEADGKYYLNTKAEGFDAGDKIEIEYCEVEQGN